MPIFFGHLCVNKNIGSASFCGGLNKGICHKLKLVAGMNSPMDHCRRRLVSPMPVSKLVFDSASYLHCQGL